MPAPGSPDQWLAWLIVLATIPVGLAGPEYEHEFRVITDHAITAAYFLIANGDDPLSGRTIPPPCFAESSRDQAVPVARSELNGRLAAAREPAAAGAACPGRCR
jgi:hypothetical protein